MAIYTYATSKLDALNKQIEKETDPAKKAELQDEAKTGRKDRGRLPEEQALLLISPNKKERVAFFNNVRKHIKDEVILYINCSSFDLIVQ